MFTPCATGVGRRNANGQPKARKSGQNSSRRLELEALEERVVLSWAGTPPLVIKPAGAAKIALDRTGSGEAFGEISTTEVDWYQVKAKKTGTYAISALTPPSDLDTVLGVYNKKGKRLAYNDDLATDSRDSQVTLTLKKDTQYFVGVTNYSERTSGGYTLQINGPGLGVGDTPDPAQDPGVEAPGFSTIGASPAMRFHLLLDFSPDGYGSSMTGSFAATYGSMGYQYFLDTDGDGQITMNDVTTAASRIAGKVQGLFQGLHGGNVNVYYADVTANTGIGQAWLNWGRAQPNEHVMVMYVGGMEPGNQAWGRAPAPTSGYNYEGFGETFSRGIAEGVRNRGWDAGEYINQVAEVAAHEYGHMLGLHHSIYDPYDVMAGTPDHSKVGFKQFSNRTLWALEHGTNRWIAQNAVNEIWRSFQTDRSLVTNQNYFGAPMAALGEVADEHDAHDHEEPLYSKTTEQLSRSDDVATADAIFSLMREGETHRRTSRRFQVG